MPLGAARIVVPPAWQELEDYSVCLDNDMWNKWHLHNTQERRAKKNQMYNNNLTTAQTVIWFLPTPTTWLVYVRVMHWRFTRAIRKLPSHAHTHTHLHCPWNCQANAHPSGKKFKYTKTKHATHHNHKDITYSHLTHIISWIVEIPTHSRHGLLTTTTRQHDGWNVGTDKAKRVKISWLVKFYEVLLIQSGE